MSRVEQSVIGSAPVDHAFGSAADDARGNEWFEGVTDFKATASFCRGGIDRHAYKARVMGISPPVKAGLHDFVESGGWMSVSTKEMAHRLSEIAGITRSTNR